MWAQDCKQQQTPRAGPALKMWHAWPGGDACKARSYQVYVFVSRRRGARVISYQEDDVDDVMTFCYKNIYIARTEIVEYL